MSKIAGFSAAALALLAFSSCSKKTTTSASQPLSPPVRAVEASHEQQQAIAQAVRPYLASRIERHQETEKLYELKETEATSAQVEVVQDKLAILRGKEARHERLLRGLPGVDQTPWMTEVWDLAGAINQVEDCLAEMEKILTAEANGVDAGTSLRAVVQRQDEILKRIEVLNASITTRLNSFQPPSPAQQ